MGTPIRPPLHCNGPVGTRRGVVVAKGLPGQPLQRVDRQEPLGGVIAFELADQRLDRGFVAGAGGLLGGPESRRGVVFFEANDAAGV